MGGQGWIQKGLGTQVGLEGFEGLGVQFKEALKSPSASFSLLYIPSILSLQPCISQGPY